MHKKQNSCNLRIFALKYFSFLDSFEMDSPQEAAIILNAGHCLLTEIKLKTHFNFKFPFQRERIGQESH